MAFTHVVRKVLPYSTLAVAVAAVYSGWIMYSRFRDARAAEERVEKTKRDRAIEQGHWVSNVMGDEVKILSFAADPGVVRPGGSVLLCYGVANASTVKIEPPVEGVRPAFTRCVETFPRKTTTYTLTAGDRNGKTVSASLTVTAR
jgi:hypothetical protein